MNDEIKTDEIKNLTINEIIYARYIIEKNRLYLKVDIYFIETDKLKSENLIIYLIQLVNNIEFFEICYLNIK